MKEPKTPITKWQDAWAGLLAILASLLPAILFYPAGGWRFYAGLSVAVIGIALTTTLLYFRARYWPTGARISVAGVRVYVGRHLVIDPTAKTISPAQAADYRRIVAAWWKNPDLTDAELANLLHVSDGMVYNALRAWRTGQLDDRSRWQRVIDRLKMRHFEDDTRYRP